MEVRGERNYASAGEHDMGYRYMSSLTRITNMHDMETSLLFVAAANVKPLGSVEIPG